VGAFAAKPVAENVYWVGAVDWAVRDFHGYNTERGTTYNAYLIKAETITLIDTVKQGFRDEMFARISSICDPTEIDVIVSNHAEPDHSGELAETIRDIEPSVVYASKNGKKALQEYFGIGEQITPVEEGQTVDLGAMSLVFAETRMCHWPDSMVSYCPEAKLLFSQDAFGMHLASFERFADEIDAGVLHYEAAKYYANILMPLSHFVAKSLEKLGGLGLNTEIVAPDHGPIWRQDIEKVIHWYAGWANPKRTSSVIVVYDTMWQSTETMARAVSEGLGDAGAHPTVMALSGTHRSDVATKLLNAGGLVVGAPTLNNEIFPRVADTLTYVKGLRPTGLIGAAFGSFGWSGESVKKLSEFLDAMQVDVVQEPVTSRYAPNGDVFDQCFALGQTVGKRVVQAYG
jgi:flavorubredoxin